MYTRSGKASTKFFPTCIPMSIPTKSLILGSQSVYMDGFRISSRWMPEWSVGHAKLGTDDTVNVIRIESKVHQ